MIVPTRDRPRLLVQAVASVLAQHHRPSEVLVVDDGSHRRGVEALLRELPVCSGLPIRALAGPGRGPGAARNTGLKAASGELVAFLDDDDLWLPHKLAWQVRCFLRRPRLGAVGSLWGEAVETAMIVAPREGPPRLRRLSLRSLLRRNQLATSGVVARRESLERLGGFDESLPLAQDWDMWLRLAERTEIAVLPARLIIYRRHGSQRSADKQQMRHFEAEVLRRALARGALHGGLLRGVGRRRLAWAHGRMGRLLAGEGKLEMAIAELKESMDLFPCNPVVWAALLRCAVVKRALARTEP